jgi:hypothetical protein
LKWIIFHEGPSSTRSSAAGGLNSFLGCVRAPVVELSLGQQQQGATNSQPPPQEVVAVGAFALGLDYRGKRIAEGNRYLALTMRVTFNGKPNQAVTGDNFRLMVDSAPVAPIDSMLEVVDANSAKDGEAVVFEIPANAGNLALQIGEAGAGETAQIPLDMATTASR